jgi:hypothetical protein
MATSQSITLGGQIIVVKLHIFVDSQTGQEMAYLYSDTHNRRELRQAASECGVEPRIDYSLGFLDEPEPNQTEPRVIPLLHYNLQGPTLERAKTLFKLVDDKELSDDLDKVLKIVKDRLKRGR